MDIPRRGPRLPEIVLQDSNATSRGRAPPDHRRPGQRAPYSSSAVPMPIPNAHEEPPPPLPPPRHLADIADGGVNGPDLAWQWANRDMSDHRPPTYPQRQAAQPTGFGSGSLSSEGHSDDERPALRRDGSSATVIAQGHSRHPYSLSDLPRSPPTNMSREHGFAEYPAPPRQLTHQPSPAAFSSSVHDTFRSTASAYDQSLVQKLNTRRETDSRTPPRGTPPTPLSASANDGARQPRAGHEGHPILKPLSLPIFNVGRPSNFIESPLARWGDTPTSSAISPRNGFVRSGACLNNLCSPRDEHDPTRSPMTHTHRQAPAPARGNMDHPNLVRRTEQRDPRISPDHDTDFPMDDTGMRRLHLDDHGRPDPYGVNGPMAAGQKRRASSPPRNEGHASQTVGSYGDLHRRRESATRSSPSPRFQASGSFSSTASNIRNNSYASTLSYAPSSITSYGGRSPGGLSPATPDTAVDSPYATSASLTSSPRVPIPSVSHQRAISDNRPIMPSRKASDGSSQVKPSGSRAQGLFICECCPKKPKKFNSQEELTVHEQEKQYVCTYCRNRFKNKNEAERHQNSLHLRRHSWSCAALAGYAAAFHPSLNMPNRADTCGYCGQDFERTGLSSPSLLGGQVAMATDHDWEARISHLQEAHKFGECNHAKKFFRADHFRQHLKHSHAGTSGKWTNMLETACMKDEPLPEPIRSPERITTSGLAGRVDMISEEGEA